MPRCPRCGSLDAKEKTMKTIHEGATANLVNWRVICQRCGHIFGYDELIPRPPKETSQ